MSTATSDKTFTAHARRRALATVVVFGLWGVGAAYFILDWQTAWPLVLFYALLILNSYYSVRAFASITPREHLGQQGMDILLCLWLALLPLNFNTPLNFVLLMSMLFVTATLKYVLLLPVAGYSRLLYAKIRVDTLGILLCFLALLGILWGYAFWTTVLWSLIFFISNIYVLWWEPHYHLSLHYESFL